ncbi:hypothetical protein [Streptomyces sp. NPDC048106]|uniref:hypothetical protein n=1 Tax=Streptomyces sp. NPDC048106 TaxID=3155750 RepID=UPI003454CBB7
MAALVVAGFVAGSGSIALAWSLSGPGGNKAFTLVGQAQIDDGGVPRRGACNGALELTDVDKGALVTVYDSADRLVATGSLGAGQYYESACVFPVVVPRVPGGSKSYSVQVLWHKKTKITSEQARTGSLVIRLG